MKSITNFFTFLVLFIASILFLTMPVNAIVYENMFDDPIGLGAYGLDTILVSEGSSPSTIQYFYTDGTGSSALVIQSIPDYCEDACVGADGCIYFVLTDGRVYKFLGGYGLFDFVDDYNTSFQLLGDMDALSGDRWITVDANSNVYSNSGNNLYKFGYPTFAGSILHTFESSIDAIAQHPDGLLIGFTVWDAYMFNRIYMYNDTGATLLYEYQYGASDAANIGYVTGMYATENGDIYYCLYDNYYMAGAWYHKDGLFRLNASDSWSKSTLTTFSATHYAHVPSDLFISNDGIIYASFYDDTIKTYSTDGLYGGYSYYYQEGATGIKQMEYDTSTLNSLYTAYNNNSVVELVYSIDIDLVQGVTTQDFYDSDGYNQYYWIIDVLDEDGIKHKSSIVNTFDEDYCLGSGWHIVSIGNLQYSADPWQSGNWSAVLYEYDTSTGLRAQLDTCEFEIYNKLSDTIIADETPGIDPALTPINRIDALLSSNAFIGLLIILACMGAFGKIGGVAGLMLGTVSGVSLSTMLGYVPAWMFFLMVLALCVVFVSKLITGFGGND